jgi:hypothetical protein
VNERPGRSENEGSRGNQGRNEGSQRPGTGKDAPRR